MSKLYTLCLIGVGLVNFIPVLAMFSTTQLEQAYSVQLASNELQILMRHRALLFGVLGGFVLYSAFVPAYQVVALVMAAISMVGFILLALQVGDYNDAIRKGIVGDLVGIAILVVAVVLRIFS